MWSRGSEMGVKFEEVSQPQPSSGSAMDELRERLRELEAEVARLESRIYQLTEGAW